MRTYKLPDIVGRLRKARELRSMWFSYKNLSNGVLIALRDNGSGSVWFLAVHADNPTYRFCMDVISEGEQSSPVVEEEACQLRLWENEEW